MNESLERRVQRLEDIHRITQLVQRYAMGADTRNDPAIMGGCVTSDVVAIFHGIGQVQGRDEFTKFAHDSAKGTMLWTAHFCTTPVTRFNSDGDAGTAFFYLWELARARSAIEEQANSTWIAGWYENEIKKEDGEWLFSKIELVLQVFAPAHDLDWKPALAGRFSRRPSDRG
jgi:hypothetical protein